MSGKFVSFIASCTLCIAVGAEGGFKRWVRNNRNDDDGFAYLFEELVDFCRDSRFLNPLCCQWKKNKFLSDNFLTKIVLFYFS
jgi:hypothetical protein